MTLELVLLFFLFFVWPVKKVNLFIQLYIRKKCINHLKTKTCTCYINNLEQKFELCTNSVNLIRIELMEMMRKIYRIGARSTSYIYARQNSFVFDKTIFISTLKKQPNVAEEES